MQLYRERCSQRQTLVKECTDHLWAMENCAKLIKCILAIASVILTTVLVVLTIVAAVASLTVTILLAITSGDSHDLES